MKTSITIIGLALATGIVVGVNLPQDAADTEPAATGVNRDSADSADAAATTLEYPLQVPTGVEIAELERRLGEEVRARRALEKKLEALSRRVTAMNEDSNAAERISGGRVEDDAAAGTGDRGWFDEQALLESGIDTAQASELKFFFEQLEMERLRLRDQSVREDWDRSRLREEMRSLDNREEALRERLGESAYDAYLYASGKPNRVAVTSVLASAQAGQAGILAGDHIIRYDSQRIYSWRDLREATTSGDISDTVEVEIERDGERLQFFLARGPMGIRMDSLSVAP